MAEPEQSFLTRWARRKALVRHGGEPAEPTMPRVPAGPAAEVSLPVADCVAQPAAVVADPAVGAPSDTQAAPEPRPTLEDVQSLTPESDFSRFVARDVDPEVKNLAMKKLFADPHFNVMDGLDTYIDDYNTPDPIPKAMFKQLVQARMLGLLDDELEDQIQTPNPLVAAAEPVFVDPALPPAADAPAAPDECPVQATGTQDAQVAAESAPGGRAWESNPPGTA